MIGRRVDLAWFVVATEPFGQQALAVVQIGLELDDLLLEFKSEKRLAHNVLDLVDEAVDVHVGPDHVQLDIVARLVDAEYGAVVAYVLVLSKKKNKLWPISGRIWV